MDFGSIDESRRRVFVGFIRDHKTRVGRIKGHRVGCKSKDTDIKER